MTHDYRLTNGHFQLNERQYFINVTKCNIKHKTVRELCCCVCHLKIVWLRAHKDIGHTGALVYSLETARPVRHTNCENEITVAKCADLSPLQRSLISLVATLCRAKCFVWYYLRELADIGCKPSVRRRWGVSGHLVGPSGHLGAASAFPGRRWSGQSGLPVPHRSSAGMEVMPIL